MALANYLQKYLLRISFFFCGNNFNHIFSLSSYFGKFGNIIYSFLEMIKFGYHQCMQVKQTGARIKIICFPNFFHVPQKMQHLKKKLRHLFCTNFHELCGFHQEDVIGRSFFWISYVDAFVGIFSELPTCNM